MSETAPDHNVRRSSCAEIRAKRAVAYGGIVIAKCGLRQRESRVAGAPVLRADDLVRQVEQRGAVIGVGSVPRWWAFQKARYRFG